MDKKPGLTTVYERATAGTLEFETHAELGPEIDAYLETVGALQEEYAANAEVVAGLRELQIKLQALKHATAEPTEVLREKLEALTQVPLGPEQTLHLAAFRRRSAAGAVGSEGEYVTHVRKLMRNTAMNLVQLMLFYPDDTILQKFVSELKAVNLKQDYRTVRGQMVQLGKSPQLWHYNERKKGFLLDFLRPFQDELGKPIEELTEEELQAALKQVEKLRETRLEEMTNLVVEEDHAPFRAANREMHAAMNGRNADFWGGPEVRDQFIELIQRIVRRFSFNLEQRFLVFRTRDGGFAYLVGFADEAFEKAMAVEGGRMALAPHLKVFLRGSKTGYREIVEADYGGDSGAYYAALKTAVVPFLTAISVMVEYELSPQLKDAFDMWT